jgi:hypothetical protein
LCSESLKDLIERKLPSFKGAVILSYKEFVGNGASANAGFVDKSATTVRAAGFEQKPVLERRLGIPADPLEAALQLQKEAQKRGIEPKLIGGLAFKIACPSSREGSLARNNNDIDLVIKRKDVGKL